jgi:hypothetical protein
MRVSIVIKLSEEQRSMYFSVSLLIYNVYWIEIITHEWLEKANG